MNLDRALVLLFATIGAVTGFTPSCRRSTFSVSSSSSNVRVASALSSEVAAESVTATPPPAFDAAIHVGNISFGKGNIEHINHLLLLLTSFHLTFANIIWTYI